MSIVTPSIHGVACNLAAGPTWRTHRFGHGGRSLNSLAFRTVRFRARVLHPQRARRSCEAATKPEALTTRSCLPAVVARGPSISRQLPAGGHEDPIDRDRRRIGTHPQPQRGAEASSWHRWHVFDWRSRSRLRLWIGPRPKGRCHRQARVCHCGPKTRLKGFPFAVVNRRPAGNR